MNYVLGGRTIGAVLGRAQGAAASQWWLAGGIAASDCVAAYQAVGAASLAASYVNLANPGTYNAAPGVAPTWAAATGWSFNGSNQYLATGINPYPSSAAWSILVRYSGSPTSGALIGIYTGALSASLIQIISGAQFRIFNNSNQIVPGIAGGNGVVGFSAQTMYMNGVAVGATMSVGTTPNIQYSIGAYNGAFAFYNGVISAVWIARTTITAAQVAAVTAAMNLL